jgi:hypothetical protein
MKLIALAAAAAMSLAVSAPAFAAGQVSATLQSPVAAKTKVVAGGSVFQCVDATCTAAFPTDRALTPAACKQLVKEVGPVSAYGRDDKQLDVSRCNTSASN